MDTKEELLGKLLLNLISLETLLRAYFYETRKESGFVPHDKLNIRDRVPVNSYTDFKQLNDLIKEYNESGLIKGSELDRELIINIRDLVHHGRALSSLENNDLIIVKFSKENSGYVSCELKQQIDKDWLKSAVNSIYQALTLVELNYPPARPRWIDKTQKLTSNYP